MGSRLGFCRVPVLQDWRELTETLLDDTACEKRGDAATTVILIILQAAVQRACTGNLQLTSTGQR